MFIFQWSVLITTVGERPLLNDRGGAHHLIERAPDGPISGVNGRPRAALRGALLAPVLDATVSLLCP